MRLVFRHWVLFLAITLVTSISAWAALCRSSPSGCPNTIAYAVIPPGGSCSAQHTFCTAVAISYTYNGAIYEADFVQCPTGC